MSVTYPLSITKNTAGYNLVDHPDHYGISMDAQFKYDCVQEFMDLDPNLSYSFALGAVSALLQVKHKKFVRQPAHDITLTLTISEDEMIRLMHEMNPSFIEGAFSALFSEPY